MKNQTLRLSLAAAALSFVLWFAATAFAGDPWPAESLSSATNLTWIEGPGTNDFYYDLSGAVWNPVTRQLWVCRNGPDGSASKFWVIAEDGLGSFQIDYRNGNRGEWTGFGDLEDLTLANYNEDVVYLIVEGEERIKEYDVSVYGTAVLRNNWDTRPYLPLSGGYGAEGIAFIPDEHLASAGFRDQNGLPYTSHNGMGGLMFVAHQNGGRLYVFDLNQTNGTFSFVGAYLTGANESAGLAFDRSDGLLYILHGGGLNTLEVVELASTPVGGGRRFNSIVTYSSPGGSGPNMEGIAIVPNADCADGHRSFFLTIDGGGANSLFWFRNFPCTTGCLTAADCSDGLFCNGVETCVNGACVSGSEPCSGQSCNEAVDACIKAECYTAADCDDGNVCNGPEACVAGECVAGSPLSCSDGNPCTDDSCDPAIGCVYLPDNTNSCDDGLFCNGTESCANGVCMRGPSPCTGQLRQDAVDDCVRCLSTIYCPGGDPDATDFCRSWIRSAVLDIGSEAAATSWSVE